MTAADTVKFHCSLNVSELDRSVRFYEALFGIPATKRRPDYAKFEPASPPLVLSLIPMPPTMGGTLNHVGLRLPTAAALVDVQRRLEMAGIATQREEGVECCYAKQTKFWVEDPDRTLWELYVLEGDIDHRGAGQTREQMLPQSASVPIMPAPAAETPRKSSWSHTMMQPIPARLPQSDDSIDEALLRGTFNDSISPEAGEHLLAEVLRILKPGGTLTLHNLVADRPFPGSMPSLPGPAAFVRAVPIERDLFGLVAASGFSAIRLAKYASEPCFVHDGVQMRECLLTAAKPVTAAGTTEFVAIYRGPLRQVEDDGGNIFPRGERVNIDAASAAALSATDLQALFTLIASDPATAACGA